MDIANMLLGNQKSIEHMEAQIKNLELKASVVDKIMGNINAPRPMVATVMMTQHTKSSDIDCIPST